MATNDCVRQHAWHFRRASEPACSDGSIKVSRFMLMDVKLAYLITQADVPTEHGWQASTARRHRRGVCGGVTLSARPRQGALRSSLAHPTDSAPVHPRVPRVSEAILWTSHPCQGYRQAPGEPRMNPTDGTMDALEGRAVLHALRGAERSSEANVVLSSHSSYAHVRG